MTSTILKLCCANCFRDDYLRRTILSVRESAIDVCGFCGAETEKVIDPRVLQDSFELLTEAYVCTPTGKSLIELLTEDWGIFAPNDVSATSRLLRAILQNDKLALDYYEPRRIEGDTLLQKWQEFRSELMTCNRFFPRTAPDLERLANLMGYLVLRPEDVLRTMFRARIMDRGVSFASKEMGPPPPELSTHGRANPAGIPYLYLASDARTAVSELRPHVGDRVSVADFTVSDDLKLVDLRDPRVSPFEMENKQQIIMLRNDLDFLAQLGVELSRPVGSRYASVEYLPSQYLCEFIKSRGFDGVIYRSSVGLGFNIALYDAKRVTVGSVVEHEVVRANVDIARVRI